MVEDAEFAFQSFRQSPAAHRSGLLVLPPHETEVDRLKAVLHQGEELLETTRLSAAAAAAGPGGVEPLSEHDLPSFVAAPATVRGPRPTVAGGPKPPAISPEVAAKARAGAGAGAGAGADPGGDENDAPLPAATDAPLADFEDDLILLSEEWWTLGFRFAVDIEVRVRPGRLHAPRSRGPEPDAHRCRLW